MPAPLLQVGRYVYIYIRTNLEVGGVIGGRELRLRGWECAVARYGLIIGRHMGTSSQFGQVLAGRG